MKFSGRDEWFRESLCGAWRITKIRVSRQERYEVWFKGQSRWIQRRVNLVSFDEAREWIVTEGVSFPSDHINGAGAADSDFAMDVTQR